MVFVLYVCAVFIVQYVRQLPECADSDFLQTQFGSVIGSMDTLFELMLNPYLVPYHGVLGRFKIITIFLLCFVVFGSFGMVALLTGVINEQMFEKNEVRNQELAQER